MANVYVEFDVIDQTLRTHIPTPKIRAGTKDTYYAKLFFDAAWEDLSNIRAVFFRDNLCKPIKLTEENGVLTCRIFPEVIAEPGQFAVGLFAGSKQITNLEFVPVFPGFKNEIFNNEDVMDWFDVVDKLIDDILQKTQWKSNMTASIDEESTAEQYPNVPAVIVYTQAQDLALKTVIEGLLQVLDEKLTADIGTKSPIGHHHDNRYFTEDEIISILLNYTTTDISANLQEQIRTLTTHMNAILDSDDTTLDQLSEIVAYIKSNKELIDAITTSKANAVHDHDDRYFTQEAVAQFVNSISRVPVTVTETISGTQSVFECDHTFAQVKRYEGIPYIRYLRDVGAGANLVCEAALYAKEENRIVFASAVDESGVSYRFVIEPSGLSVTTFNAKEHFNTVPSIPDEGWDDEIPNVFAVRNAIKKAGIGGGSGGEQEVFAVATNTDGRRTYIDCPFSEFISAVESGKIVKIDNQIMYDYGHDNTGIDLFLMTANGRKFYTIESDGLFKEGVTRDNITRSDQTFEINSQSTDSQFPTAKAVYDFVIKELSS